MAPTRLAQNPAGQMGLGSECDGGIARIASSSRPSFEGKGLTQSVTMAGPRLWRLIASVFCDLLPYGCRRRFWAPGVAQDVRLPTRDVLLIHDRPLRSADSALMTFSPAAFCSARGAWRAAIAP